MTPRLPSPRGDRTLTWNSEEKKKRRMLSQHLDFGLNVLRPESYQRKLKKEEKKKNMASKEN